MGKKPHACEGLHFTFLQQESFFFGGKSESNISNTCTAVSYTHLDVYKRQIGTYTTINSVLRGDESLENEYQDIRNLAKIYNRQEKAEEIIADIQQYVDQGKQAAEGKEPQRILIAEKWEGEYDIYHAKTAAGDIAAQMGAEPLGQAGWTDEEICLLYTSL